MVKTISLSLPEQETLEQRFIFVQDDILRTNLAIAFRYVTFLVLLENEYTLPGAISYSIYKNIILYTSSIVESCSHYLVKELIRINIIDLDKFFPKFWVDKECKKLYEIDANTEVVGIIRHNKTELFTHQTQLKTVNEVLLRAKIFSRSVFNKAEGLRKTRNRIHLAGLKEADDLYQKSDVQEAFDNAKEIISIIEINLNKSKKTEKQITIPSGTIKATLLELNKLLQGNRGNDQITLVFQNGHGNRELALPFGVNYDAKLKKEIQSLLTIDPIE